MNIEESFLNITDFSLFPRKTNYVSKYNEIANTFNKSIHPEIKAKMVEYESDGYYNDHGEEHIKMVIERASRITSNFAQIGGGFELSNYETFILLVSIHLHDAAHLIDKRSEHTGKTHEILSRFFSTELETPEIMTIANIARAHGGKNDPIGVLSEDELLGQNIRSRLLAAILRLGDELADDTSRASKALLMLEDQKIDERNRHIKRFSEIYHRYSEALHSVKIEGNEIKLSFCISETQLERLFEKKESDSITKHFLLDEIYARTEKTFLETLYCNRFFPANYRINVIKVKINLLEKYSISFRNIAYELKESGYPLIQNGSLIDVKDEHGEKIDGAYIAETIKNKKYEESI